MGVWIGYLQYCINVSESLLVQRFAWGVIGGSITGMQLFIKDTFVILHLSHGLRPWKLPVIFYILLALGITVPVTGLALLTRCMKRYDATYSNAMNAGSLVVSTSIMGAVHHKTFSNLASRRRATMYIVGLVIIIGGLWILVRHTKELTVRRETDDDDTDTIAELAGLSDSSDFAFDEIPPNGEESVGLMLSRRNSSSSKPRPRTASNSSLTVEEGMTIVRRPSSHNFSPSTPMYRTVSGGNRDRTASSSSFTMDDADGGISMVRRPSFHNFPPATPTLRTNRDRTASSCSATNNNNRDRTSSTSSVQLY